MKTKVIAIVLLIAALIGVLCFIGSRAILYDEEMSRIRENLVFLQKTIKEYAADAKAAGKVDIYPDSLRALVEKRYMNPADLDDVTRGADLEYIKPSNNTAPSTIIIKAKFGRTVLLCPIDGAIQIK